LHILKTNFTQRTAGPPKVRGP